MENDIKPLLVKINKSKFSEGKREKLREILSTIRIPDMKNQGFEMLFNQTNESKNIDAWHCKRMIVDIMMFLGNSAIRPVIEQEGTFDIDQYMQLAGKMYIFFDNFDNEDFEALRNVEDILDYGEEKKDPRYPCKDPRTVDNLYHNRIVKRKENLLC